MKNWNWGGISVALGIVTLCFEFPWMLVPVVVLVAWVNGVFNRKLKKPTGLPWL